MNSTHGKFIGVAAIVGMLVHGLIVSSIFRKFYQTAHGHVYFNLRNILYVIHGLVDVHAIMRGYMLGVFFLLESMLA